MYLNELLIQILRPDTIRNLPNFKIKYVKVLFSIVNILLLLKLNYDTSHQSHIETKHGLCLPYISDHQTSAILLQCTYMKSIRK